jgi:hypothetical protein
LTSVASEHLNKSVESIFEVGKSEGYILLVPENDGDIQPDVILEGGGDWCFLAFPHLSLIEVKTLIWV